MSPVDWIRRNLAPLRSRRWRRECPGRTPVPAEQCRAILDCDSVRLTALTEGEHGRVTCLEEPGSRSTAKLAALGVLPGAELLLVQRYPAFVFRMGYSEFAVDVELAGRIRVRRE